mmetsp:Transcript_6148/g.7080  ORF Transcript_6148/g.7080 Transcript_6148/m.7080 type:complete len:238 (-) Transcript_6148:206-919(-)
MRKVWSKQDPSREKAKDLAKIGAHSVIDGGQTDIIGLATALGTDATEVFIVDVADAPDVSWKTYFAEAEAEVPLCSNIKKNGFPFDVWHIFEENQDYAREQEKNLLKLTVDEDVTEILEGIHYGTIHATTRTYDAAKNEINYFGIKEGVSVTIHLFQAGVCTGIDKVTECKELFPHKKKKNNGPKCGAKADPPRKKRASIGLNQNFEDYGVLVAEIADALSDKQNRIQVCDMLMCLI